MSAKCAIEQHALLERIPTRRFWIQHPKADELDGRSELKALKTETCAKMVTEVFDEAGLNMSHNDNSEAERGRHSR